MLFLGSKARVKSAETKVLRFDAILGGLVTSGKFIVYQYRYGTGTFILDLLLLHSRNVGTLSFTMSCPQAGTYVV